MKCPSCGHWNKPSFPRCFQCGEPLQKTQLRTPEWREQFEKTKKKGVHTLYDDADPVVEDLIEEEPAIPKAEPDSLASEMTKLKDRRARGVVYLEAFRKNASEQGIAPAGTGVTVKRQGGFFADVPDDTEETLAGPRQSQGVSGGKRRPAPYRVSYNEDDFDPLPEDLDEALYEDELPMPFDQATPLAPPRRSRKRARRRHNPVALAKWTVRMLCVLAVAFLAWQGVLYLGAANNSASNAQDALVSIEALEVGGYPGHRIQIAGKEGSKIYIAELMRSYIVVDGVANIEVADYEFYKDIERLESEQLEVTMTPTVWSEGVEQKIKPIHFMVDIPLSPIRLISPQSNYTIVSTSIYNMSLQVEPQSKVIINGENISDMVTANGTVSYNPPVQAIGENIITISVRALYCRENNLTVTLYREPQEIPLELAADTQMKTDSDEMLINATTLPGAHISIESPTYSIDDKELKTNGKFSFRARMTRVGENTITIRASVPGKKDAVLEHTVTYLPTEAEYTPKAWALTAADYSELLNNIQLRTDTAQIYRCKGIIKEILSANPQIVIMDTGQDGKEQLVMLQNGSQTTWVLGTEYRVYADVSGLYNVMPKMIARYTYYDGPKETSTPSP